MGSALGLLVVTLLTRMSWAQRLALVALVLVVGLAWVLWSHRAEIRAGADTPADAPPAGPPPEKDR